MCPTATLGGAAPSDDTYNVYYSAKAINLNTFTSTETSSICGDFTYTCTYGDDTVIDTSIFTFK